MKKAVFLILLVMIFAAEVVCAEETKLTTIVPNQTVLRFLKGAIGNTYSKTTTVDDNSITNSSLLVEGHVGIGTTLPAKNGSNTEPLPATLQINKGSNGGQIRLIGSNYTGQYDAGVWTDPVTNRFYLAAWNAVQGITMDLTDGDVGIGIGTSTPQASLDMVTTSGGSQPTTVSIFGAWQGVTVNPTTPYTAVTDGFAIGWIEVQNTLCTVQGSSGSNLNNIQAKTYSTCPMVPATSTFTSIILPVRKGEMWKVITIGTSVTAVAYWIPLGTKPQS